MGTKSLKCLATINEGFEEVCALELQEAGAEVLQKERGKVFFKCKSPELLAELACTARSPSSIYLLLATLGKEGEGLGTVPFEEWLDDKKSFVLETSGLPKEEELAKKVIEVIKSRTGAKVVWKQPDVRFVLVDRDVPLLCVDVAGEDLGRRDYRIFLGSKSLKGNIAYSLLRLAGYDGSQTLLDPFCRSGEIPIEAALFASRSPVRLNSKAKLPIARLKPFSNYCFEELFERLAKRSEKPKAKIFAIDRSFAALSKASKNAKIAGVERWIEFKKLEIEHLANSLIQESIDLVVSVPLQPSRSLPTEFVQKVYDKLWLQLEQIVTKNGKILFAFNNKKGVELLRTIADKAFYVHLEKPFLIGKESWIAIGFCKP